MRGKCSVTCHAPTPPPPNLADGKTEKESERASAHSICIRSLVFPGFHPLRLSPSQQPLDSAPPHPTHLSPKGPAFQVNQAGRRAQLRDMAACCSLSCFPLQPPLLQQRDPRELDCSPGDGANPGHGSGATVCPAQTGQQGKPHRVGGTGHSGEGGGREGGQMYLGCKQLLKRAAA